MSSVYCIKETLNAVAVLRDIAVVLGAGGDAALSRLVGNSLRVLCDGGEHTVERASRTGLAERVNYVVAHNLSTERNCNVELIDESCNLLVGCLVGLLIQTRADGVGVDLHTERVSLSLDLCRKRELLFLSLTGDVDELDSVKADVVSELGKLNEGELACSYVLIEGIRTY